MNNIQAAPKTCGSCHGNIGPTHAYYFDGAYIICQTCYERAEKRAKDQKNREARKLKWLIIGIAFSMLFLLRLGIPQDTSVSEHIFGSFLGAMGILFGLLGVWYFLSLCTESWTFSKRGEETFEIVGMFLIAGALLGGIIWCIIHCLQLLVGG